MGTGCESMARLTGTETLPRHLRGGCSRESSAMGESLTERRRVRDEGLRVVNRCQREGNYFGIDRSSEEAQAKFVPAAAVTRTARTLFGITGLKEFVGCLVSRV